MVLVLLSADTFEASFATAADDPVCEHLFVGDLESFSSQYRVDYLVCVTFLESLAILVLSVYSFLDILVVFLKLSIFYI
mgnify:CR=1 FL=1